MSGRLPVAVDPATRANMLARLLGTDDPIQQLPAGPQQPGPQMESADPRFTPGVAPRFDLESRLLGRPVTTPQAEQRAYHMANLLAGFAGSSAPGRSVPAGLPMDAASRAARARTQGFTIDAYKGMYPDTGTSLVRRNGQWVEEGTRVPVTEFQAPGRPYAGFFSDSPQVANRFAQAFGSPAANYPVQLRIQNPLVIEAQGRPAAAFQFEDIARQHGTLDDMARYRGAFAEGAPYDGVIMRGTADEGTVYIPRTPQQARSRFANFDPRQLNNPDMLASLAAAGLLGAGAQQ